MEFAADSSLAEGVALIGVFFSKNLRNQEKFAPPREFG